jgi:carbon-monoxide dehydrogenase medium subunit
MDLPPVLIALGANVVVLGRNGDRRVPMQELHKGYYETVLARDELISDIIIPPQRQRRATYMKCSTRASHDWPALGVAVSLDVIDNVAREPYIVVSAVSERPVRASAAEAALAGQQLDPINLRNAGEAAADTIETTADARGSAAYKRELVRVYVERALRAAVNGRAGGRP